MTTEAVVIARDPMEPTMTKILSAVLVAASLVAGTAAQAQSYNAPAGIPTQTAPGGFNGR